MSLFPVHDEKRLESQQVSAMWTVNNSYKKKEWQIGRNLGYKGSIQVY